MLNSEDEDDKYSQISQNVRGLIRRQETSANSHIERIRGISGCSRNEEVMKLKNELAMQRLLRQQRKKNERRVYNRPSVHQIHEYSPMNKAEKFVGGSPMSDLPMPSQRYVNYNRQHLVE